MKAIVVRQPWATLIALGVKQIETRPFPPNGPMRPEGVRGLPGCSLERGERIAIVAAAAWPDPKWTVGDWMVGGWTTTGNHAEDDDGECACPDPEDGMWCDECKALNEWNLSLLRYEGAHGVSFAAPLPLGAVVCTVTVDDALPIVGHGDAAEPPYLRNLPTLGLTLATLAFDVAGHRKREDFTDQLPLGDFTPGRWGWLLSDPRPCEPIPCKGRQGVFELPAEIAEVLS